MKTYPASAPFSSILMISGTALAQTGSVMDGYGGNPGGGWMVEYGGFWSPTLLVVVVIGAVAWLIRRKDK